MTSPAISREADSSPDRSEPRALPFPRIALYSTPSFCVSFVAIVVAFYFTKFATDVLLVAPSVVGSIHAVARVWDALTDPLAGYLSDRTRTRLGRRRPWAMAAALPLAASIIMLWCPPGGLGVRSLNLWLLSSYLLYETARAMFLVPWSALGLELATRYEQRTRLFAWKHLFIMTGALSGFGVYLWISRSEDPKDAVVPYAVLSAFAIAGAVLWAAWRTPERTEYQTKAMVSARVAFADVLGNPLARLLLALFAAESFGIAATFALVPYVSQYVLNRPSLAAVIGLSYMLPQALLVPLCIAKARQIDKRRLWFASMAASSVLFGIQIFYTAETSVIWIGLVSTLLGAASGVGAVCGEALQADIVDYDEYRTGGRKEGSYVALWNIAAKLPSGITPFLALGAIELAGYLPNQPQSDATRWILLLFFSLFPAACFALGALALLRLRMEREDHEEMRAAIKSRASAAS